MSLKAKIEAIVYAAEEPITVAQIAELLRPELLAELAAAASTATTAPDAGEPELPAEPVSGKRGRKSREELAEDAAVRARVQALLDELVADYSAEARGIEVQQVAGGYRMATKPEHHDAVRAFAKSLKPPLRLSLAALETLAVIAYKQPVTVPEISEIRGVEASGVIGTLLDRRLIPSTKNRLSLERQRVDYRQSEGVEEILRLRARARSPHQRTLHPRAGSSRHQLAGGEWEDG